MNQFSYQADDETLRMIAELAEWWGLPRHRHNTQVIARCVEREFLREKAKREEVIFMIEEYKWFSRSIVFRRQVIFENADGVIFCAVDFGNFRDGDREWVNRLEYEIKAKIDKFLAGDCSDYELQTERAIARLIRHNFDCHKFCYRKTRR